MRKTYIELMEDSRCVNMIEILESGERKEKLIAIEDFVASITASLSGKNYGVEASPIFREVKGVRLIQFKKYGPKSHLYVLFKEKHIMPMQLFNRFYDNVGLPNLLYGIHIVNNRLSKIYVVATKDRDITSNTKIYRYPFTNVSGNNGGACIGRNIFKPGIEDNDLEGLFNVPNQFMSMPNNLDYYRIANNSKGYECEELIKSLVNKTFDDNLLVLNNIPKYSDWFDML